MSNLEVLNMLFSRLLFGTHVGKKFAKESPSSMLNSMRAKIGTLMSVIAIFKPRIMLEKG